MVSERPIESTRKNAAHSAESLGRTRLNATKHGLACEAASAGSPELVERRAKWSAQYQPAGDAAHWALNRAVAASLRIER